MNYKQYFSKALISFFMSLMGTNAFATDYDIAVENNEGVTIYYNYINGGKELEVTSGFNPDNGDNNNQSYKGDVIIPKEVTYMERTRKVTSIGTKAFKHCYYLTSVKIPNSVTKIGDQAFDMSFRNYGGTSLTSVTIGNSVKSIGKSAFAACKELQSITLPSSVTSIGDYAFYACTKLNYINIPDGVDKIGKETFCVCTSLTSITIPKSVTSIEESAFLSCQRLTSIEIPEGVTSIGYKAFYDCASLTSITLPNTLNEIDEMAFAYCDISTIISNIKNPFKITGVSSNGQTFNTNTFYNATLYVPKGTISKYKATKGWKDFVFIVESESTGINKVEVDKTNENVLIYDLNGKRLSQLRKGINIIRQSDGITKKVNIK